MLKWVCGNIRECHTGYVYSVFLKEVQDYASRCEIGFWSSASILWKWDNMYQDHPKLSGRRIYGSPVTLLEFTKEFENEPAT